jgi:signal transduction histidine kinase
VTPQFKNWPWILVVIVLFGGELIIQIVWHYYQFSAVSWGLVQFLMLSWVVLASVRICRSRATSARQRAAELDTEDSLDQVVRTDVLIGSIVHEIRDPLNRLSMRLQNRADDDFVEDVEEISRTVDRIETVFRGDPPAKRWISFPRLMKRLLDNEDHSDRVRVVASVDWLHCAPESFLGVLSNLVENSLDAYKDESGEVVVEAQRLGPEFCVTVADEAGGIDADLVQSINQDQVKESAGMGLGLMISRKVMDRHGGRMVVETESGESTTVTLTIPVPGNTDWEGNSS